MGDTLIESVDASVFTVPTDAPEADGALTWDSTTMVLVQARAGDVSGTVRHLEWFHDHVRIESMFFDGALDPAGGVIRPDPDAPGLGLTLRASDVERYRTG
jgi:hypothetical protein